MESNKDEPQSPFDLHGHTHVCAHTQIHTHAYENIHKHVRTINKQADR